MGNEHLKCQQNGWILSYICESSRFPPVQTHRIIVSWKPWGVLHFVLLGSGYFLLGLIIVESGAEFLWPLPVLGSLAFFWARRKRVVEEVIVVMPTLGVQLETVYYSKKVHRRFLPLERIVAPVINEAVNPVTCYFYLALLLRGEDNLVLAFLGLRPPLKMLVPIWRSLCEAVGTSTQCQTLNAPLNADVETEL